MNASRAKELWPRFVVAVACCCAALAVAAPLASADLEFSDTSLSLSEGGSFSRQAGAHPDLTFEFKFPAGPPESARNIDLDFPPGLYGNPVPFATCSLYELNINACPVEAQVGVVEFKTNTRPLVKVGLFSIDHGPDVPALFGFKFITTVSTIVPRVRPGDYGISSGSFDITQTEPVEYSRVRLWGVPADPLHDPERHGKNNFEATGGYLKGEPLPSGAPLVPFLTNPTSCAGTAEFRVRGDSWEHTGAVDERVLTTDANGTPFVFEGCESVPFDPELKLDPTSRRAHSPTGLDVTFELPYNDSPTGIATSTVKRTAITFPEGMTISPAAAAGQGGCGLAQVGLGDNRAPSCPPSSELGTVEIETPLLDYPLRGRVVLAAQKDNPFGSNFAIYMLVAGPGFYLKLPGELIADPRTGQLRSVFDELPPLPVESLRLQLRGGPAAPLTTPQACGAYSVDTEVTPWARPDEPVVATTPVRFDEDCAAAGFSPGLKGGTLNPTAGKRSPFVVRISRQDGEQNISRIDVTLPEGQLASLKGVAQCPEAAAPTGACPAASQIGVAGAAVGVGSSPLQVPQPGKAPTALFLGGPYKGAPLSLIALVPAQAGPFDLGNVVVRTALQVDPATAQVTAVSDPLPQFVEGVPLQYREVRIELNRPGFAVNPTNCERMSIESTLTSVGGAEAHPSVPYQVGDCASLGFGPHLKLAMKGSMKRSGNPALSATLKAPAGQANIAATTVILPKSAFIDNAHVNNPCTRAQFDADQCPPGSVLGTVTAHTPLLDQPLTGPVYFKSNGGARELPDLVADLQGTIDVELTGFIDSVELNGDRRVRTRFLSVPDAPVSSFTLKLKGGKKGLIENSANLCAAPQRAKVQMAGQNGRRTAAQPLIQTSCGKKGRKK